MFMTSKQLESSGSGKKLGDFPGIYGMQQSTIFQCFEAYTYIYINWLLQLLLDLSQQD